MNGQPNNVVALRPGEKKRSVPLKKALMDIFVRHGKVKAVGLKKPVSNRTQDWREDCIFLMFKQLKELGFKLSSPDQLREWHVRKLVERWEMEKLSAATIQNRLSVARMLSVWIGKAGMIRGAVEYVKDPTVVKRSAIASHDHSWKAKGIDKDALFAMVSAYDKYVGMQLRLMSAFGLRREEAVMFKPHRADLGGRITVRDGTKGGRDRDVSIDHPWQRAVLDAAKAMVTKVNGHVGHPDRDLKQALRRFNYVLVRHGITKDNLGITSHGLRHERLNDMYEEISGLQSPVRTSIQNKEEAQRIIDADPMKIDLARAQVSSAAGHNRLSITNAYIGSTTQAKKSAMNWKVFEGQLVSEDTTRWVRLAELGSVFARTPEQDVEFSMLKQQLNLSHNDKEAT
jgi:integrase